MKLTAIELRQAGFTDEDIETIIEDQRPMLNQAGFSNVQINQFYGITPKSSSVFSDEDMTITTDTMTVSSEGTDLINGDKPNQGKTLIDEAVQTDASVKKETNTSNVTSAVTDVNVDTKMGKDTGQLDNVAAVAAGNPDELTLNKSDDVNQVLFENIAKEQKALEGKIDDKTLTDGEQRKLSRTGKFTRDGVVYTRDDLVSTTRKELDKDKLEVINTKLTSGPATQNILGRLFLDYNFNNFQMMTINDQLSTIGAIESDGRNIVNEDGTKGGVFQISNEELPTLLKLYGDFAKDANPNWQEPEWYTAAKVHNSPSKLDLDHQRALALIKLVKNPESEHLLPKAANGDVDAWVDLYMNYYNPSDAERPELEKRARSYFTSVNTGNYKYELPELATWNKEWWLTSAMMDSYAGRKFVKYTGGAGDQNVFTSGYRMSVNGLFMAYHTELENGADPKEAYQRIFMHETQNFAQDIVQSVIMLANDTPWMIAGFGGGTLATVKLSGLTGQLWLAPAAPFVGMGTAFALPETLRDVYIRAIMNDEVNNFDEFLSELMNTKSLQKFLKYELVGAATFGAGKTVKAMGGNRIAQLSAEIPTMVTLSSILEGQVPTRKDFAHAAVLMFGIHGASRGMPTLINVYRKYGMHPRDQVKLSEKRSDIKQEYIEGKEPSIFRETNEFIIEHLEKKTNIKLVPAPKFSKNENVKTSIESSENGKVLDRIEGKDGTIYYIVEKSNGEKVNIKETELQKQEQTGDIKVEIEGNKIKISEKVEKLEDGQKSGRIEKDVVEYVERTEKGTENFIKVELPKGVAEILDVGNGTSVSPRAVKTAADGAMGNKNFVINSKFYPKVAKEVKNQAEKIIPVFKKMSAQVMDTFGKGRNLATRTDKVMVVTKDGVQGAKNDTLVLRNSDGFFGVNKKMFDALSKYEEGGVVKDAEIAMTDGYVVFLQQNSTKPIGYIRVEKANGKTEQQSRDYYDNYKEQSSKSYYDKHRSSKGDSQWGAPEEPAGAMPNKNLHFKDLFNNHKGLDTFDLVDMVRVLIDQTPIVKKMPLNLRGYFKSIEGRDGKVDGKKLEVAVNKALAENPKDFTMTLAHEIGHLIDYLPEATMKKGNILGSLGAMKGYLNKWIDGKADGAKPLNAKEIAAMRKEAETIAERNKNKTKEELEKMSEGDAKITPDTILQIFRDPKARDLIDPSFYDAFTKLSDSLKKEVVKDAMKGMMSHHMKAIADKINGRKPKSETTTADAQVEFARMFETEMRNRGLVNREMITNELKVLSQRWKPFDRASDPKYTAYRDSPRELMADFMMAFLLRPNWTRVNAPKSFDLFMHHMYKRPEVQAQYLKIQNELAAGSDARMGSVHTKVSNMFVDSAIKVQKAMENQWEPNKTDSLHATWFDTFAYIYRRIGGPNQKWMGKIGKRYMDKDAENLNWRIEDYRYRHTYMQRYGTDFVNKIIEPLNKMGYNIHQLSTMLLYRNLMYSQQRAGVANPLGLWARIKEVGLDGVIKESQVEGRTAKQLYESYRQQHPELDRMADQFFALRQEYMRPVLEESKFFSKEDMAKILDNNEYITFSVEKHVLNRIEKYGGYKIATPAIKKTEGTLGAIIDPLMSTLEKDMLLLTSLKLNRLKYDTIMWMTKNKAWLEKFDRPDFTKDVVIQKAKMQKFPNQNVPEPAPQGMSIIDVVVEGKVKYYYMNRVAADAFAKNPYKTFDGIQYMSAFNSFFRSIFTEYNPLFWGKNMFRDTGRAVRNLPKATYLDLKGGFKRSYLKYLIKSIKPTYRSIFGNMEGTALTRQMEKEGIYIAQMEGYRGNAGEKALQRMLRDGTLDPSNYMVEKMMQKFTPKQYETFYGKTMGRFLDHWGNIARLLERMHKVAGYMYYKDAVARGDLSTSSKQIMLKVQADVGSPSFLRTGSLHPVSNNIFIFWNAMKEGIRGDYVRAKEDPVSVLGKMFMYNTAPKIVQKMLKYGVYSVALKEFYDGVSEYDEQNYIIIPLGYTKEGKTVYFRIPQDETARVINGIIGKAIDMHMGEANLTDFGATLSSDVIPSVNPAIELFGDLLTMGMGHNPTNDFTGEYAIDPLVWEASDSRTKIAAFQYVWNTYGGGALYRFKTENIAEITSELEDIFAFPLVGTFANTFIKIGKQPEVNNARRYKEDLELRESRLNLDYREAINLLLTGKKDQMQDRHKMALVEKADVIRNHPTLQAMLVKSNKGTELLQLLATANTNIEKLAVMKAIADYEETASVLREKDLEMARPLLVIGDNKKEEN